MKIKVNTHLLEIKRELVNEKEIKANKCEFEFCDEITDEFVKEAYFTFKGKSYKEIINNNECDIPNEVLTERGLIEIGVVAYLVENEEYVVRYNPRPVFLRSLNGSLKENAENSKEITPSEMEQFEQQLEEGLQQVANVNIDATQTSTGSTIVITDRDGIEKTVYVYNGQDGQDGVDGVNGITPTIGANGNWFLGDVDTGKPSRGVQGIQGIPGKDGQPGVNGKDAKINGTNTLSIQAGSNINISQSGSTMTISATGGSGSGAKTYIVSSKQERDAITDMNEGDICIIHGWEYRQLTPSLRFDRFMFTDGFQLSEEPKNTYEFFWNENETVGESRILAFENQTWSYPFTIFKTQDDYNVYNVEYEANPEELYYEITNREYAGVMIILPETITYSSKLNDNFDIMQMMIKPFVEYTENYIYDGRLWVRINVNDYNNLSNLPKINGNYLVNDIDNYNLNINDYSKNEVIIGRWINNKPIYRKVFTFNLTSQTTEYTIDVDNIDQVTTLRGIYNAYNTSQNKYEVKPVPYVALNRDYQQQIQFDRYTKKIAVKNASTLIPLNQTMFVVMEYTKTTDY